jgi:hypothetical protein
MERKGDHLVRREANAAIFFVVAHLFLSFFEKIS